MKNNHLVYLDNDNNTYESFIFVINRGNGHRVTSNIRRSYAFLTKKERDDHAAVIIQRFCSGNPVMARFRECNIFNARTNNKSVGFITIEKILELHMKLLFYKKQIIDTKRLSKQQLADIKIMRELENDL